MIVQPIVASKEVQPPSLPNLEAALSSIVSRDRTGVADVNFTLTFFSNPARAPTSPSGAIMPADWPECQICGRLFATEWLGS